MTRAPKAPKISERALSQQIQRLFALADCVVYSSEGQHIGGTRNTPGPADLMVFFPMRCVRREKMESVTPKLLPPMYCDLPVGVAFFEVKTPAGVKEHHRLAPLSAPPTAGQMKAWRKVKGQAAFAALCRARAIPYGIGGMDEAWAFLASVGLARAAVTAKGFTEYLLVKGAK